MPAQPRWPWETQGVTAARKARQAQRAHHTSRWLTIFLPMLVGGLLTMGAAVWVIRVASPATVSHSAAVVVIFVTLACLLSQLPLLALLVALIVLTTRAQRHLPEVSLQILQRLEFSRLSMSRALDKTTSPIIRIQAMQAAWRAAWRDLRKGGQA